MNERPSRDEYLMRMAAVVSSRGTCNRAAVGAVISREGRVISTGYVGAPSGLPDCLSVGCQIGTHGGCTRTVHAEANAIAFAARFGTQTEDAELHCTHSPCLPCAQLIVNGGIGRFVYERAYRDPSGLELLKAAQVEILQLSVPTPELTTVGIAEEIETCTRGFAHEGPCNGWPEPGCPGYEKWLRER